MPHLHADEQIIRRFDHHWIRFVRPVLTYFVITAILITVGVVAYQQAWVGSRIVIMVAATLSLCATHTLFRFLFSEALEVGYITQYRLTHFEQRILITDNVVEIPFDRTKNVIAEKHGLLANILGYGDLTFTTTGTTIKTIPRPDKIAELIQELTGRLKREE